MTVYLYALLAVSGVLGAQGSVILKVLSAVASPSSGSMGSRIAYARLKLPVLLNVHQKRPLRERVTPVHGQCIFCRVPTSASTRCHQCLLVRQVFCHVLIAQISLLTMPGKGQFTCYVDFGPRLSPDGLTGQLLVCALRFSYSSLRRRQQAARRSESCMRALVCSSS